MALRKEGIDALERIMLQNAEQYDQTLFGDKREGCGTLMCAAGFAHLLKVGQEKFDRELAGFHFLEFANVCEQDGAELLGLTCMVGGGEATPQVFENPRWWPVDLRNTFENAKTPLERVRLYIAMLRERANDDGTIRKVA